MWHNISSPCLKSFTDIPSEQSPLSQDLQGLCDWHLPTSLVLSGCHISLCCVLTTLASILVLLTCQEYFYLEFLITVPTSHDYCKCHFLRGAFLHHTRRDPTAECPSPLLCAHYTITLWEDPVCLFVLAYLSDCCSHCLDQFLAHGRHSKRMLNEKGYKLSPNWDEKKAVVWEKFKV